MCFQLIGNLCKWIKKRLKLNTDFKTLLLDNTKNLNVIGMNIRKEITFLTVLKCSLLVFTFVLQFYGNIRGMFYLKLERRQICVNLCHLLGVIMISFRYLHMILARNSFNDLIDHVIESTSKFDLWKDLEIELSNKYSRLARLVQVTLYLMYRIIVGTNVTLPIFFIKWYMLCPIAIPGIDIYSHPGYEIILIYYVFLYYYLYLGFHIYDSYFYFFAFVIKMRSKLFCELASKIGDFDSTYDTPMKQKKLIFQLYELHKDITRFSVKFADTFSVFALFTGIVSLFFLTMAMYLRNLDPMYTVTLVCVTTTQFLLICIFGEMLVQESIKMGAVVYSSNWYNIEDIPDRKMIVLFILRSQTYNRLTAYGIYDPSMETFSHFLRKSYSFYALLRNMS